MEFERDRARCILLDGKASVCRLSDPIYEQGLPCLLASEGIQGEGCGITVSQSMRHWLTSGRGPVGSSPLVKILARCGASVLAEVVGRDDRAFECLFRGAQSVVLEVCEGVGSAREPALGAALDPYDRLKVIRPDCQLAGTRGEVPGSVSAEADYWSQDPEKPWLEQP